MWSPPSRTVWSRTGSAIWFWRSESKTPAHRRSPAGFFAAPASRRRRFTFPRSWSKTGRRSGRSTTRPTSCPASTGAVSIPDPSPNACLWDARFAENQFQRITITDDDDPFAGESVSGTTETLRFDASYAVRTILDIVPNPFVGREIVGRLLDTLRERGFDAHRLGALAGLIVEELRNGLQTARDDRAESVFKENAANGRIQFHLRLDGGDWRMPFHMDTTAPENAPQVFSQSGGPLGKSLFVPVYQQDLNTDEREVAVYLDAEQALSWWHRNVARSQYGIQGWQGRRIYPDFVFAVGSDGKPERITVLETKGDHLDNIDTGYKRELMDFLSDGPWHRHLEVRDGLDLTSSGFPTFQYALVLMRDWKTELPKLLSGDAGGNGGCTRPKTETSERH